MTRNGHDNLWGGLDIPGVTRAGGSLTALQQIERLTEQVRSLTVRLDACQRHIDELSRNVDGLDLEPLDVTVAAVVQGLVAIGRGDTRSLATLARHATHETRENS